MPCHRLAVPKCRLRRGHAATHGSPRRDAEQPPLSRPPACSSVILRSAPEIRPSEHPGAAARRSLAQVCGLSSLSQEEMEQLLLWSHGWQRQ